MNIQSVTNRNFEGRRDRIDAMIRLDDRAIRQRAYERASEQVDEKRNKKVTNALMYSAPLASGIATALLTDSSKTTLFTKEISGVAGRMAKGLKVAAFLTTALAAIDLLGLGRKKAAEKSKDVRKFDYKHPTLSFMGTLAAGIAVLAALPHGIARVGKLFTPEFTTKVGNKVGKLADKINENNVVDVVKHSYNKLGKKSPDWLKNIGALALDWSPAALMLGGIYNSVRGNSDKTAAYIQNYNQMKEKQVALSRARLREISNLAMAQHNLLNETTKEKAELEFQNDFLMQNLQNREEMEILADGAKSGMPEEVQNRIDEIRMKRELEKNSETDDLEDIDD